MSKRLENMRQNPKADWKISDIEAICKEYGALCELRVVEALIIKLLILN